MISHVVGPVKLDNLRKMYDNELMTFCLLECLLVCFFCFYLFVCFLFFVFFLLLQIDLNLFWVYHFWKFYSKNKEKGSQFHFLPQVQETLATRHDTAWCSIQSSYIIHCTLLCICTSEDQAGVNTHKLTFCAFF